jgi:hypothetical protein
MSRRLQEIHSGKDQRSQEDQFYPGIARAHQAVIEDEPNWLSGLFAAIQISASQK